MTTLKYSLTEVIKAQVRKQQAPQIKQQLANQVREHIDRGFSEHEPATAKR